MFCVIMHSLITYKYHVAINLQTILRCFNEFKIYSNINEPPITITFTIPQESCKKHNRKELNKYNLVTLIELIKVDNVHIYIFIH
jgi:hypothetical protein